MYMVCSCFLNIKKYFVLYVNTISVLISEKDKTK